jgi:GAF domain-containing protein
LTPAEDDDTPNAADAGAREYRIARTFVELADTLVDEFDLSEFLHMLVERCVDLLDIGAAGVQLADQEDVVRMAAASSEKAELLELFAADTQVGPCVDCVRTGRPVISTDLAADADRWPRFAAAAELCGFRAVHVVPMRLRGQVIGALSLLSPQADGVRTISSQLGQALADVATIGILQQRAIGEAAVLTDQLQTALNTRVIIEQAKGVLVARSGNLSPEEAFAALRGYARSQHLRLSELARDVVRGTVDVRSVAAHRARTH